MTNQAVGKMLMVWLLAFLLYGPAIIFWELVAGKSIVPADQCFAEFYCTWYFLLSASTFEFFTPLVSVAFFNFSIYLNIHRREKNRGRASHKGRGELDEERRWRDFGGGSSAVFFIKTRKVSSSEPAAVSAVIEEDEEMTPPSSGEPSSIQSVSFSMRKTRGKRKITGGWTLACSGPAQSHSASSGAPSRGGGQSRLSRDKKIAKSLAVIVCVFAVCWAPYTLLMIIRAACSGTCVEQHWYEVTFWLLWINSAINPFLYPLCHSSFRRAFAKILCPKRQSVRPHAVIHSSQWHSFLLITFSRRYCKTSFLSILGGLRLYFCFQRLMCCCLIWLLTGSPFMNVSLEGFKRLQNENDTTTTTKNPVRRE